MNSQVYHIKKDFWELKGEISRVKKSIQDDSDAFEQNVQGLIEQMREDRLLNRSKGGRSFIERDPPITDDSDDAPEELPTETTSNEDSKNNPAKEETVAARDEQVDKEVKSKSEEDAAMLSVETTDETPDTKAPLKSVTPTDIESGKFNAEVKREDDTPASTSIYNKMSTNSSGSALDCDLDFLLSDDVLLSLEEEDDSPPDDKSVDPNNDPPSISSQDVDVLLQYFTMPSGRNDEEMPPSLANSSVKELLQYVSKTDQKKSTKKSTKYPIFDWFSLPTQEPSDGKEKLSVKSLDSSKEGRSRLDAPGRSYYETSTNPSLTENTTGGAPSVSMANSDDFDFLFIRDEDNRPSSQALAVLGDFPAKVEVAFEKVNSFLINGCCCSYTFSIPSRK